MRYQIHALPADPFPALFALGDNAFRDDTVIYVHPHCARPGCFAASVTRPG